MSDDLTQELDDAFVKPDRHFKKQKLAPYTEGSRLLMLQVRDEADSPIFFVYAFIYIHIMLAKDKKAAIKLAWDKQEFRERVMDWSESMNEDERNQASILVSEILTEANKPRVNVVPSGVPQPPGNE